MKSDKPEVSIIILTYNQCGSIAAAIDSVLAQDYGHGHVQIVIGDDCSTDGTREICERYAAEFPDVITLLPQRPNRGVVLNYFDAFAYCEGEFVTDCAGDDVMGDSRRIALQVGYLRDNEDKTVVMSDWTVREGERDISSVDIPKYAVWRNDMDGRKALLELLGGEGNFPFLSAAMFRREVLTEALRERRHMVLRPEWGCEDVPVLAALTDTGAWGYVPCDAAVYVQSAGGISRGDDVEKEFEFLYGAASAVVELSSSYGLRPVDVCRGVTSRLRYLAVLLTRINNAGAYARFRDLCKMWDGPIPWQVRVRMWIVRQQMRICRNVRKI